MSMPPALETPRIDELLWRRYILVIDLYKFYLDLVVKALLGYYAVTGAIFTFYFAHSADTFARRALALPTLLSFTLASAFMVGAKRWQVVRLQSVEMAEQLEFPGYEL